jgi:hypothetical protein
MMIFLQQDLYLIIIFYCENLLSSNVRIHELNYIKFLNHVDLWLKIDFQTLVIYLKSVT